MAIDLNKFRRTAWQEGVVSLDSRMEDGLIVKGKTRRGKIAFWLKQKFMPGRVRSENRRVMEAFITALRNSREYRDESVDFLVSNLRNLERSGKALETRVVRDLLRGLDTEKEGIKQFNSNLALRFSTPNIFNNKNSFEGILKEVAEERKFEISDTLNTSSLQEKISKKIVQKGQGGRRMVSMSEAERIAEKEIKRFVENKQELLSFVSENESLHTEDKAFWKEFVLKTDIASTRELQAIIDSQSNVGTFMKKAADGTNNLTEFLRNIDELRSEVTDKINSAGIMVGASSSQVFLSKVLNCYMQKNNVSSSKLQALYSFLTSQQVYQLRGVLNSSVYMLDDGNQITHTLSLETTIAIIMDSVARNLGVEQETTQTIPNYVGQEGLPSNAIRLLQNFDIYFPISPTGSEDKGEGTFPPKFLHHLQDLENAQIKKDINSDKSDEKSDAKLFRHENDGMHENFVKDLTRLLNMSIEGQQIEGEDGEAKLRMGKSLLKELCKDSKGQVDVRLMRTITSLSHQGFWADVLNLIATPDDTGSPIRAIFGFQQSPDIISVSKDSETGDIIVKREYNSFVGQIVDPSSGSVSNTDPTKSYLNLSFTLKIPAESIKEGNPRVEIVNSSYRFEFHPETEAQRLIKSMKTWSADKGTRPIGTTSEAVDIIVEEVNTTFDTLSRQVQLGDIGDKFDNAVELALGKFLRTDNPNILGVSKFNYDNFDTYTHNIAGSVGVMILDGKDISDIYRNLMEELSKTENVPDELCIELAAIYDRTKSIADEKLRNINPDISDTKMEELSNAFAKRALVNVFVLRFLAPCIFNLATIEEISQDPIKKQMAINISSILQSQANGTRFRSPDKQIFNALLDDFNTIFDQTIARIMDKGREIN